MAVMTLSRIVRNAVPVQVPTFQPLRSVSMKLSSHHRGAHAPKLRAIPKVEQQAWTAQRLQQFLRAVAGHRLFPRVLAHRQHRDAAQ